MLVCIQVCIQVCMLVCSSPIVSLRDKATLGEHNKKNKNQNVENIEIYFLNSVKKL
jgi:hypothetical protein